MFVKENLKRTRPFHNLYIIKLHGFNTAAVVVCHPLPMLIHDRRAIPASARAPEFCNLVGDQYLAPAHDGHVGGKDGKRSTPPQKGVGA